MDYLKETVGHLETHSIEGIKNCFENGLNPNVQFKGEPLFNELTSGYLRSSKFKDCVKLFAKFGLEFNDKTLLSVLMDDSISLKNIIQENPNVINHKYSFRCAYTPLYKVTLLHICAEFNHLSCAKVLVQNGASINKKAGIDKNGFGGQTPFFHTVNQNSNNSIEMMDYLLSKSVDLQITVKGLIWGKDYEWETLIPSVNPISYAMMGLLPQMHRNERIISEIVSKLLKHKYEIDYLPNNIPNKYLE